MGQKYYHLSAEVNGMIKDVLVSKEAYDEERRDGRVFFLANAGPVKNYGLVEIIGGEYLPDVIG